jgi:hypothetical protein
MFVFAETRADDGGSDGGIFEDPAAGDIGEGDPVFAGNLRGRFQDALIDGPAAGGVDEALVFRPAPVGDRMGLGLTKPFLRQESTR